MLGVLNFKLTVLLVDTRSWVLQDPALLAMEEILFAYPGFLSR